MFYEGISPSVFLFFTEGIIMEQLVIYGCYAEGFLCHGTVEINPQKP